MPPVVAFVSAAASAISAAVGAAIAGITVAQVVGVALSLTFSVLSMVLAPKPKTPDFGSGISNRTRTVRQPLGSRQTVYGKVRLGGTLTFIHSTGANDKYLHMVITLTGHRIKSYQKLFLNGKEVLMGSNFISISPPKSGTLNFTDMFGNARSINSADRDDYFDAGNKVRLFTRLGGASQDTYPSLISETGGLWTAEHRQRDCANAYVRLEYDKDVFTSGIPDISFLIEGKADIFDPRTGTNGYTTNAALCLADYLSIARPLGLGALYGTEIDSAALIEAANICDETVTTSSGSEVRYACNGSFEADKPETIIPQLVGAMAGSLVLQGGKFFVRAGAYRQPTLTLTEDDVVGSLNIQTLKSLKDRFNGVRGVMADPDNNYQPSDFSSIAVPEYIAEDDDQEIYSDIELNFTTSQTMAQRIARIILEQNRRQITVSLTARARALQLQPGDTVRLSLDRYGWVEKTFLVKTIDVTAHEGLFAKLDLEETDANVYAWSTADEGPLIPTARTTLPNPKSVAIPDFTLGEEVVTLNSGTPGTNITVAIINPENAFGAGFEVQFRREGQDKYRNAGSGEDLEYIINNVEDTVLHYVRVRAVNIYGVRSDWREKTITPIGSSEPPGDVTSFAIDVNGGSAALSWAGPDEIDVRYYQINFAPVTMGATWEGSQVLVQQVAKSATSVTVPTLEGTYLIKAVDYGGRVSDNAALVVNDTSGLVALNSVSIVTENPSFAGTKDNVVLNGVTIVLGDNSNVFDYVDVFTYDNIFQISSIHDQGFYYFDNDISLDAVYTSRLTASVSVNGTDLVTDVFSFVDVFALTNVFGTNNTQWAIELQIRTTNDDPSGSPVTWSDWRKFVVGDYSARGFQFRVRMQSLAAGVTPQISALSVSLDMADRQIAEKDLVVTTAGLVITFTNAFRELGGVAIAAQDLSQGDYWAITSKSRTGFTIQFYNSSGSPVQRTFDYVAQGYGKAA